MAEGSRKGNRPPDRPARVGSQDDRVQNPGDRSARLGSPDAGGAKPANWVARNHNSVEPLGQAAQKAHGNRGDEINGGEKTKGMKKTEGTK